MTIKFDPPQPDADGFFNFYNGGFRVSSGDEYLVKKTPRGEIIEATAEIDEYAYFVDQDGESIDDAEWVKPKGLGDRITFFISATQDDIPRLTELLLAIALPNDKLSEEGRAIEPFPHIYGAEKVEVPAKEAIEINERFAALHKENQELRAELAKERDT